MEIPGMALSGYGIGLQAVLMLPHDRTTLWIRLGRLRYGRPALKRPALGLRRAYLLGNLLASCS